MQGEVPCSICGAPSRVARRLYDDRYGYPGEFELRWCDACEHAFLNARFTPAQLTDLYSNYYPRSAFDLDSHRPYTARAGAMAWLDGERSAAFRWVPRNVRVLDIGCGFGETLGYHEARGCEAHGVEVDENILRVGQRFGYRVRAGLFDPSHYQRDYFDFVTMHQVIEHVSDPVATLRGVAAVLKPGGQAILTTPNAAGWGARLFGGYWAHWHSPYHLQLFTARSLSVAARKAGLFLERTETITPSAWLEYQEMHLATRPAPGTPSSFWKTRERLSGWRRIAVRAARALSQTKLNHLITRAADMLGLGDNRVYVLRKAA